MSLLFAVLPACIDSFGDLQTGGAAGEGGEGGGGGMSVDASGGGGVAALDAASESEAAPLDARLDSDAAHLPNLDASRDADGSPSDAPQDARINPIDAPTNPAEAGDGASQKCSGATPAGHKMCGPGKTCIIDKCGTPLTFVCISAGSGLEGSTCSTDSDCSAGLTCIGYDSRAACRTLCLVDNDCPAGNTCAEYYPCSADNPAIAGRWCSRPCSDLVTAAGSASCGTGFKCNFGCGDDGTTATPPTCDWQAGLGKSGPCQFDGDCAAGYTCVQAGSATTTSCTKACASDFDCPTGSCTGVRDCGGVPTNHKFCE